MALLNLERRLYEDYPTDVPHELVVFRYDLMSTWILTLRVAEVDGEVEMRVEGRCFPRLLTLPLRPLLLRREARAASERLQAFGEYLKQQWLQDLSARDSVA